MRRSSSTISPEPYDTFQANRAAAAVPAHPEFTPTTSASPAGATTRSAMPSRSSPPWESGGHVKVRELVDAMRLPGPGEGAALIARAVDRHPGGGLRPCLLYTSPSTRD